MLSRISVLVALGLLCAPLLFAEEQVASPTPPPSVNADGMAEAQRVMVIGSNIPTAAEVGPNPVQTIDRYTIEKSGERNTEELLRNLPVANANGVPTSGTGGQIAFGEGAASVALRGLDPGATLVLIDGHRVAPHPSGTNFGTQSFVDLNTIPRAAIESIEILTDGASSIYGADAIAGVVNIKLRRDYRGAEMNAEYGNTTDHDSGEVNASVVFGVGDDKTNITGVLNYYSRNSIFSHDRPYDIDTPLARTSRNSSPFNLEVSRAAAEAAAGRPITEVDPSLDTFFAHAPFFTHGNAPASDYVYTEGPSATFPLNRFASELPDAQRYGAFVDADHKIFGDQMVAYADLLFQRAEVDYEQPPAPTFNFATPGEVSTIPPLAIPPHVAGATLGGPGYGDVGLPINAFNPFNPFQQIISGDSRGRPFEFGPRDFDTRTDSLFTTVGLRGDKLINGTWGYDAAFRYSRVESDLDLRTVSTSRFQRTLNAADPIFDPTSSQFIGTTVPFNPFEDYRVPIANNTKLADFVVIHPGEVDRSTLTSVDLNIYSTQLWQLPAGSIGIAFGAQFQHETLDQEPDKTLQMGDALGIGGVYLPISGSRESYAGYAETSIPIFGSSFSAPGLHALEFTAAVRFEAFSNDTNVMVPKFGMRWQPLDDSLTIRATWGEGFKQPTLVEQFAPPATGTLDVFDPIKNEFVSELRTTFLPNPGLQPEDSRNFNTGIVYSPKFAPGLTVTIDVFNIETIGWINPNPDTTPIIARIENGHGLPGESLTRDGNGHLTSLTYVSFVNSGTQKVRGADFGIAYELPTSFGIFRSNTQATFLDSYQFSFNPGENELELRSTPTDQFSDDAYLKWKGTSRLEWTWRGFNTGVTARYRDGFHEFDVNGNEHWVKQTWFFDLQASYSLPLSRSADSSVPGKSKNIDSSKTIVSGPAANSSRSFWKQWFSGTTITLGCTNVFDHDPPRSNDNFPRYIYDTTGRFVYFSVTKKFW